MRCYLTVLLVALSALVFANTTPADTMSVATILLKTQQHYAGLPSYIDSGMVEQRRVGSKYDHDYTFFFKTAYCKTGQFAFEYYKDQGENSLYTFTRVADTIVRTWWAEDNRTKNYTSLVKVLRETMYVFPRRSVLIPGLLLQEFYGKDNILNTIKDPVLNVNELIDNADCYKITGTRLDSDKITVWIDKRSLKILQVETEQQHEAYNIFTNYHIYPLPPNEINEACFAFRPNRYIDVWAGVWHRTVFSRFGILTGLMLLYAMFYFAGKYRKRASLV